MVGELGNGELHEYKWVRTDPNNPDAVPVPPGEGWMLYEPMTIRDRGYFTYYRSVSQERWNKLAGVDRERSINLTR